MKHLIFLPPFLLLFIAEVCWADGLLEQSRDLNSAAQDQAIDAKKLDKRLPPVVPGQEVSDGSKKMKLWSTTGPVVVAEVPEFKRRKQLQVNENPSQIIVDDRDRSSKSVADRQ